MAGLLALGIASPDAAIEESQMKVTAATSLAIVALAMSPAIATAKSIKNQVPEAALAAYCATVPVDSETSATITLDDGTVLNGSIHCEAEDLIIGSDDIDDLPDDSDGRADNDDLDDDNSGRGSDDDQSDDDDSGRASNSSGHDSDDDDDSGHRDGDDD